MTRSIILTAEVEAGAETLFQALTTRGGLSSFWTPAVEGEATEGNRLSFGFAAAPADLVMTVTGVVADESVRWHCQGPWPYWTGTDIEWSITAAEPTRVMFAQRGWPDEQPEVEFGSVAYAWATVLGALKSYAETGVAAPALQ